MALTVSNNRVYRILFGVIIITFFASASATAADDFSTSSDDGTNFWYRVLRWVAIICPLDRFFHEIQVMFFH